MCACTYIYIYTHIYTHTHTYIQEFPSDSVVKNLPANSGDTGDVSSIPGLGRLPGERDGNPLQYSCLENSMDREPGGLQSMRSQRVGHDLATEHMCMCI